VYLAQRLYADLDKRTFAAAEGHQQFASVAHLTKSRNSSFSGSRFG
jgi:hypothetical protein